MASHRLREGSTDSLYSFNFFKKGLTGINPLPRLGRVISDTILSHGKPSRAQACPLVLIENPRRRF